MENIEWQNRANCKGLDAEIFFPDQYDRKTRAIAMAVCKDCAVIEPCLEHALADPDIKGIYGGTTERGRKTIRKSRSIDNEGPYEAT